MRFTLGTKTGSEEMYVFDVYKGSNLFLGFQILHQAEAKRAGESDGKLYMVGIGETLHIEYCISHTTESGVYTCAGSFSDLLE